MLCLLRLKNYRFSYNFRWIYQHSTSKILIPIIDDENRWPWSLYRLCCGQDTNNRTVEIKNAWNYTSSTLHLHGVVFKHGRLKLYVLTFNISSTITTDGQTYKRTHTIANSFRICKRTVFLYLNGVYGILWLILPFLYVWNGSRYEVSYILWQLLLREGSVRWIPTQA